MANMKTIEEIRRGKLDQLRVQCRTVSALAEKLGKNQSQVSQWLNASKDSKTGKPRTINSESARMIEQAFGKNSGWMDAAPQPMQAANIAPAAGTKDYVPLISWVQAGGFTEAIDTMHIGDEYEQVPISVQKKPHTFALAVVGDSMMPTFPEGMRLIVEPEMDFMAGDFVIAKNGGDATFKQLVRDSGEWYLKPLNPQYPTKPLGDSRIIGVVREAVIKFR